MLTLVGAPTIIRQPDSVTSSAFNDAQLSVDADGATGWKWYRGTEALSDGPGPAGSTISGSGSATLTVHGAQPANAGRYHVEVSNSCGTVSSAEVALVVCAADFNADGFVDIFDFNDFVTCFEGGACPPGKSADFNNDGFPDIFDFNDFVTAFEFGC